MAKWFLGLFLGCVASNFFWIACTIYTGGLEEFFVFFAILAIVISIIISARLMAINWDK